MKISAHISKKVPTPREKFGSQQFGASLEMEVSDAAKPEEIQARIRRLYAVISDSINEQIATANQKKKPAAATPKPASVAPRQPQQSAPINGHANGTRFVPSTTAQQRAIHALCRNQHLDLADVLQGANVAGIEGLSIRAASGLIDKLKGSIGASTNGGPG